LNRTPYPFDDNSVDEIVLDNVLEHLLNPINVLNEIYRISKAGAVIHIYVPYFRSHYSIIDPTHRNFFGVNYFNYFDPSHPFNKTYQYFTASFKVHDIILDKEWLHPKPLHKILLKYANHNPYQYESRLSHIFPLSSLYFKLEVLRKNL
jgi:ubiquinone/menaquinone biosynthesis C-methylase UbiE